MNFLGVSQVGLHEFSVTNLPMRIIVINAEATTNSTGTMTPGFTDTVTEYLSPVSVSGVAYSTNSGTASVTFQGVCAITSAPVTATTASPFPTLSVPSIIPVARFWVLSYRVGKATSSIRQRKAW